ncbi:MAG: DUF2784 family protein [Bacteroidota bacterium]
MYWLLDIFFLFFHSFLIIFNLFGWVWKKTRKANLVLLLLTGLSWFVLGIWYGIGYCPLTDWHWEVLRYLGNNNLPGSYVKYLVDRITGLDIDAGVVDIMVVIFFFAALIASVYTNIRQYFHFRMGVHKKN